MIGTAKNVTTKILQDATAAIAANHKKPTPADSATVPSHQSPPHLAQTGKKQHKTAASWYEDQ